MFCFCYLVFFLPLSFAFCFFNFILLSTSPRNSFQFLCRVHFVVCCPNIYLFARLITFLLFNNYT
ncbi:hypothetical protein GLOIN_2v1585980, partial [Rhizophagus irregularis DAOM 181602=DAOM 197198]